MKNKLVPDNISNTIRFNQEMNITDRILKDVPNNAIIPDSVFNNLMIFDEVNKGVNEILKGKTSDTVVKERQEEEYNVNEVDLSHWEKHKNKYIIGSVLIVMIGVGFFIYKKYKK